MSNYVHDTQGSVRLCSKCARNQTPEKPCPIWLKWNTPSRMLNCDHYRDPQEAKS